jgi:zinc and cadmium transporter
MTDWAWLGIFSVALLAASLLGSWLPRQIIMTHTRTQMVLSLVSGLMLGVALCHLIPHSFGLVGDIDLVMAWALVGLVFMLLLLRLFHFHQHDFVTAAASSELSSAEADSRLPLHADLHADSHAHAHSHSSDKGIGALGLFTGLCVHTVIDGIALGAVMLSEHGLGLGVFLAILLHKPLDSLSIETVMANAGWASAQRWLAAIVFAALCPLAAMAFYLGMAPYLESSLWLSGILAFAGGAFICIALSDLLPEVQFHSHDRVRLTLLFLMGIGLALGIGWFEPAH